MRAYWYKVCTTIDKFSNLNLTIVCEPQAGVQNSPDCYDWYCPNALIGAVHYCINHQFVILSLSYIPTSSSLHSYL